MSEVLGCQSGGVERQSHALRRDGSFNCRIVDMVPTGTSQLALLAISVPSFGKCNSGCSITLKPGRIRLPPDRGELGVSRSKLINVSDSSVLERDSCESPLLALLHPAPESALM